MSKDIKKIKVPSYIFKKFSIDPLWFKKGPYSIHGILHEYRVLVYSYLISLQEEANIEVVCYAAIFHDVRRYNDGLDLQHGSRASRWVDKVNSDLPSLDKIKYLIKWHVPQDKEVPEMTKELKCFKDADGLDRWRIGDFSDGYLRTKTAKELVSFSKKLFDLTEGQKDLIKNPKKNIISALKKLDCLE